MKIQEDMKETLSFHTFACLLNTPSCPNKRHVTSPVFKFNPLKHSQSKITKLALGCKRKYSPSVLLTTLRGMN